MESLWSTMSCIKYVMTLSKRDLTYELVHLPRTIHSSSMLSLIISYVLIQNLEISVSKTSRPFPRQVIAILTRFNALIVIWPFLDALSSCDSHNLICFIICNTNINSIRIYHINSFNFIWIIVTIFPNIIRNIDTIR